MQRLVDAGLVGAQRASALQDQHNLAWQALCQSTDGVRRMLVLRAVHFRSRSICRIGDIRRRTGVVTTRDALSAWPGDVERVEKASFSLSMAPPRFGHQQNNHDEAEHGDPRESGEGNTASELVADIPG
jgi:hypothetical protein